MAITVKHTKVSTIADASDTSLVRPSDWNADHSLTGTVPVENGGTGASTAAGGLNNLLPNQTGNNGKVLATDGTNATWTTNGSGDVVGPASATNNAISRFDTTTGKLIKNSLVTINDTGAISSPVDASISGLTFGKGASAVSTNTAVGASALSANTTGFNNSAFGISSLGANTTGNSNTAVGVNTLASNTTGYANVAVGRNALIGNTTGYQNIAIGSQDEISIFSPLRQNTTGFSNIAVGGAALQGNTTGSNNVAIGLLALNSNTTASNNTAVGYQAGYSNTTGTQNTFIGNQAGFYVTTGSNNTVLGSYSGDQGGLDIRTASNYIVLSDGAGNPLISTNSTKSVALNGAVPQTGTGITFPATQSASSDANTLDDYEEGTWTPALGGTWLTNPISLIGKYTKIGNVVYIFLYFLNGTKSSATSAYFTGLPFAISIAGTAALTDSDIVFRGSALFANTDRVWVSETVFNGGTHLTGFYYI